LRPAPEPKAAPGSTAPASVPPTPPPAVDETQAAKPASRPPKAPLPADRPLEPIGPGKLRALREAIRSGQYPSEDVVRAGLERMIRKARSKGE
jgi:hypothetical protein